MRTEQEIRNQVESLSKIYDLVGNAKAEAASMIEKVPHTSSKLRNELLDMQDEVYDELTDLQSQLVQARYDNIEKMAEEIERGHGWISEHYVEETYNNMFHTTVLRYEIDEIKHQLHYTHNVTIKG